MSIERRTPEAVRTRNQYDVLIQELIKIPGDWIAADLTDITGRDNASKQRAVIQAASQRGLRIQTSVREGKIFVRMVVDGGSR
jgi:hypothetical protein